MSVKEFHVSCKVPYSWQELLVLGIQPFFLSSRCSQRSLLFKTYFCPDPLQMPPFLSRPLKERQSGRRFSRDAAFKSLPYYFPSSETGKLLDWEVKFFSYLTKKSSQSFSSLTSKTLVSRVCYDYSMHRACDVIMQSQTSWKNYCTWWVLSHTSHTPQGCGPSLLQNCSCRGH